MDDLFVNRHFFDRFGLAKVSSLRGLIATFVSAKAWSDQYGGDFRWSHEKGGVVWNSGHTLGTAEWYLRVILKSVLDHWGDQKGNESECDLRVISKTVTELVCPKRAHEESW